jgi:hypothetical protein
MSRMLVGSDSSSLGAEKSGLLAPECTSTFKILGSPKSHLLPILLLRPHSGTTYRTMDKSGPPRFSPHQSKTI